jgi:hypothetical protein
MDPLAHKIPPVKFQTHWLSVRREEEMPPAISEGLQWNCIDVTGMGDCYGNVRVCASFCSSLGALMLLVPFRSSNFSGSRKKAFPFPKPGVLTQL